MREFDEDAFSEYVLKNGGTPLPTCMEYELARFNARGETCVIYGGKKGIRFSGDLPLQVYKHFLAKEDKPLSGSRRVSVDKATRAAIAERDGAACFFCGGVNFEDDTMTVEHLVSVSHGGPNHMSNYVLAHQSCNRKADRMSVFEKVQLRDELLGDRVRT